MEVTIDQALRRAVEAQKAGQVQEADRLYTAILKAQPQHPDANHNLGVLAVNVGKANEALPFLKTALEANPSIAQFWISYIDTLIKLDNLADANAVLEQAKSKGAKGESFDKLNQQLQGLLCSPNSNAPKVQDPPQDQVELLNNLYSQGRLNESLQQADHLLQKFPNSSLLYNVKGALFKALGQLNLSVAAYEKALYMKPDCVDSHNNLGVVFREQGMLGEALKAYKNAAFINPRVAEIHYNIGNALKEQGQPEAAIKAYDEALSIKPDYAKAYYNIGLTLQELGKLREAISAYNEALSIKPDYVEALNNKGIILQEQGKLSKAVAAYKKVLSIQPDYAEAHRNLSTVTKYTQNNQQVQKIGERLKQTNLSESDKCHYHYTYAKMKEDLGELGAAFNHYVAGGEIRRKLLAYNFSKDQELFTKIKNAAPSIKDCERNFSCNLTKTIPIFIVGMPRSGTTLVEQILSSHIDITGAGELDYVSQFGTNLTTGFTLPSAEAISMFREQYLNELSNRANGKLFVTDKTPQNFRHLGLICAAFPEAKIIHVKRDAKATCWSNFKHYFVGTDLSYSFDLKDTVNYYKIYIDLMHFWQCLKPERIYNLDYEKLTIDYEMETRLMLKHLGLEWDRACLNPELNKRAIRTASNVQVRKKVYRGSSTSWQKFEPYLHDFFHQL